MPDYNPKQVGAVVTFPEGVTEHEVKEALLKITAKLKPEFRFESIQTGTFDPEWGHPVFYVP